MRVIYIAGKYRADTTYGVYQNIKKAEAAAIKLWQEGWCVLCPHLNTQLFDQCGVSPPSVFLEGGLELLRRCDAIFMLNGWAESEGAIKEHKLAKELGLEIYYEL